VIAENDQRSESRKDWGTRHQLFFKLSTPRPLDPRLSRSHLPTFDCLPQYALLFKALAGFLEKGCINFRGLPQNREIHGKIRMRQHIPESGKLPPGNSRLLENDFIGKMFHRLPDDFKLPNNGILSFIIFLKTGKIIPDNIIGNPLTGLENILDS
jgi:hypothetical protein